MADKPTTNQLFSFSIKFSAHSAVSIHLCWRSKRLKRSIKTPEKEAALIVSERQNTSNSARAPHFFYHRFYQGAVCWMSAKWKQAFDMRKYLFKPFFRVERSWVVQGAAIKSKNHVENIKISDAAGVGFINFEWKAVGIANNSRTGAHWCREANALKSNGEISVMNSHDNGYISVPLDSVN